MSSDRIIKTPESHSFVRHLFFCLNLAGQGTMKGYAELGMQARLGNTWSHLVVVTQAVQAMGCKCKETCLLLCDVGFVNTRP